MERTATADTVSDMVSVQLWRSAGVFHADSGCPLSVSGAWVEVSDNALEKLCNVCSWRRPLLAWFSPDGSHVRARQDYMAAQFEDVKTGSSVGSVLCDLNWMWAVEEERSFFGEWSPPSPHGLALNTNFTYEISKRVSALPSSLAASKAGVSGESSPILWCLRRGISAEVLLENNLVSRDSVLRIEESIDSDIKHCTDSFSLVLSSSPGPVRGDLPYLLMCAGVLPHNSGGAHWSVLPSSVAHALSAGWPGVRVSVAGAVSLEEPLSSIGALASSLWSSRSGPLADASTALAAARTVCS